MRRVNVDRMRRHSRRHRRPCGSCDLLRYDLLHEPYSLHTVDEMVRRAHLFDPAHPMSRGGGRD